MLTKAIGRCVWEWGWRQYWYCCLVLSRGRVVAVLQTAVQNQQTLWRSFADMQKVWWFGSGSYAVYAPLLLLTVLSVVLLAVALMTCGDKSFVHREVTWNCGTYPTARQQYSATGFSSRSAGLLIFC